MVLCPKKSRDTRQVRNLDMVRSYSVPWKRKADREERTIDGWCIWDTRTAKTQNGEQQFNRRWGPFWPRPFLPKDRKVDQCNRDLYPYIRTWQFPKELVECKVHVRLGKYIKKEERGMKRFRTKIACIKNSLLKSKGAGELRTWKKRRRQRIENYALIQYNDRI